ncbi:adenylate/guanylate cyclase domain-containing protein [Planktothrix mougeotii]|uniref:Adenylate/guanylate cyclase domain-containing protein n=1 Tax=Planktothrix mougeotii LEGE 06226 TaxID=1828728 RepID=A0ABR9UH82_9CYAN|nr:adenylate/guanylate cyclase domain-containing protein [Planktothrix mougeotii]MBE9145810.1 adenylate/guanylate cyclase domain-containing protein [Planktothrix mougeotii LEGE 06226]
MYTSSNSLTSLLESRFSGNAQSAFWGELLSNSGYFLILKSLSNIISKSWIEYLTDPTEYLLIVAMLIQAWVLSRPKTNRFWGNLVGVGLYIVMDLPHDGLEFLKEPIHLVFLIFSFLIATLQGLRFHGNLKADWLFFPLESITRTLMIIAFYIVVEIPWDSDQLYWQTFLNFLQSKTHLFLTLSLILIGLLLGLQAFQLSQQRYQLQQTAKLLGNMAEWGMGSYMVTTALNNPDALAFQQCDRTILFMDIRGFTQWCEQKQPDIAAQVLNHYYQTVEPEAARYHPLKMTLAGDEIMAIYATPQQGIQAAQAMQKAAKNSLNSYGLGAGCSVHCGEVIEGLFGGKEVRTYTVIGDVVNTGKRLEGITPAGEITVSDTLYQALNRKLKVEPCDPIFVKGKVEPLMAWRLSSC